MKEAETAGRGIDAATYNTALVAIESVRCGEGAAAAVEGAVEGPVKAGVGVAKVGMAKVGAANEGALVGGAIGPTGRGWDEASRLIDVMRVAGLELDAPAFR